MPVISFEVSYSQLAIFNANLELPFNDWTDQHVLQGFAWRPGSVSFRTVSENGHHVAEVLIVDDASPICPETIRAVEVPFHIYPDGKIEIGSITETIPLTFSPGEYLLRCEFLKSTDVGFEKVKIVFLKTDKVHFAVVRADPELSLGQGLLTSAEPAPS